MTDERGTAADVLRKVTAGGSYNNLALKEALSADAGLSRGQRGFVTDVVNGTLRNLLYIDYILDSFSNVKTDKMKPFILAALRTAVYQIFFSNRAPAGVVCDETVKLVRQRGFENLTGFVNAVLRGAVRGKGGLEPPGFPLIYSFPGWLADYWAETYPFDTTIKMCAALNDIPDVTLCANTLKTTARELKIRLGEENIVATEGALSRNALRVTSSDIAGGAAYKEGLFHIMDEASMRAVEILDPQPGAIMVDVCAGPGGKCAYAAELMRNTGKIFACDIYPHKLKLIEDAAARLGVSIIETALKNAETDAYPEADYILVDAPCSGFGLLRKKPEIKYRRTPEDIVSLAATQKRMLANSSRYVKKGGALVYSTCTVSKKENEDAADWFLKNFPFRANGRAAYLPHEHGADGFFIARFVKT